MFEDSNNGSLVLDPTDVKITMHRFLKEIHRHQILGSSKRPTESKELCANEIMEPSSLRPENSLTDVTRLPHLPDITHRKGSSVFKPNLTKKESQLWIDAIARDLENIVEESLTENNNKIEKSQETTQKNKKYTDVNENKESRKTFVVLSRSNEERSSQPSATHKDKQKMKEPSIPHKSKPKPNLQFPINEGSRRTKTAGLFQVNSSVKDIKMSPLPIPKDYKKGKQSSQSTIESNDNKSVLKNLKLLDSNSKGSPLVSRKKIGNAWTRDRQSSVMGSTQRASSNAWTNDRPPTSVASSRKAAQNGWTNERASTPAGLVTRTPSTASTRERPSKSVTSAPKPPGSPSSVAKQNGWTAEKPSKLSPQGGWTRERPPSSLSPRSNISRAESRQNSGGTSET